MASSDEANLYGEGIVHITEQEFRDPCHELTVFSHEHYRGIEPTWPNHEKGVKRTPWRIGSKNRTFIRALLTHDYLEHKHDILIQQMTFMAKNPGEPFHVLFNYKKDVEIKVQSICLRGVYIMLQVNIFKSFDHGLFVVSTRSATTFVKNMSGTRVTYYDEELKHLFRLLKALPDNIPSSNAHDFISYIACTIDTRVDLLAENPVQGADAIRSLADWSGGSAGSGGSAKTAAGSTSWDGDEI
ncbi:hypothetical protein B0H14DRAFT_2604214 [Mycena olivaceomarginata]|nr:hypothetical protein B0H14DRAFT_2604214 [Mycena olivaceomarginata]